MAVTGSKLILASGSPRRRELLRAAEISFIVDPADIKEIRQEGEGATEFALRMAREKVMSVAMRYADGVVLAADTIVALDDLVLGKPTDAADGWRILRMLSGRSHRVVTAYAIAHKGSIAETAAVTSSVKFRRLDDEEIERYLATEEPYDKAGAYGIQGIGAGFISAVEGARSNVMGLPVHEVVAALARYGIYPAQPSDG